MLSAALAMLVAGVGVGFGWQPMPGSRVTGQEGESELVVQVDPKVLERLADGATIPLSADVPAEAGRVARVRLAVAGDPKTARRETRLKPIGEPSTIVLTQYTTPEVDRYGIPEPNYGTPPTGAAQPLATTPAPTTQSFDPYTQVPPAVAAASDWNTNAGASTGSVPTGPLQRIGAEIQTAAQPLQDGVQRMGNGVRQFGDNIAGRADQLRDQLGRPLQNGLFGGGTGPTDPSSVAAAGDPGAAVPWNGGATSPPMTPPYVNAPPAATTTAGAAPVGSSWNVDDTTTPGSANGFGNGGAGGAAPPFAGGTNVNPSATNSERWVDGNDPRFRSGTGATNTSGAGGNFGLPGSGTGAGGLGPSGGLTSTSGGTANASGFGNNSGLGTTGGSGTVWDGGAGSALTLPEPPSLTTNTGGFGQGGPSLGSATGAAGSGREISRGMLGLPGDRALEGTATTTTVSSAGLPATGSINGGAATPPNGGALGNAGGSLLGSPSWTTGGNASPANTSTTTTPTTSAQPDGRQQAAVILAWVLLFASVAGNMYLFWSYLDVRTKYRSLVRKTARAVGSRFSAA